MLLQSCLEGEKEKSSGCRGERRPHSQKTEQREQAVGGALPFIHLKSSLQREAAFVTVFHTIKALFLKF